MDVAIGLALLALTVYTSTLSYCLRTYSRARLSLALPESRRGWVDLLDEHERPIVLASSFTRLVIITTALWFFTLRLSLLSAASSSPFTLWLTIISLSLALGIVAVAIPNALAIYSGEAILARSMPVLWGLRWVMYPFERVLSATDFVVRRLLGKPEESDTHESQRVEQEIRDAISEGEAHGAVDEEAADIIESVFELRETPVSAIMTPRTDITAIDVNATPEEIRETIVKAGHSRIPVFEGTKDHIVGVLYAKDLLGVQNGEIDVRKLMRNVPYVPETKTIDQLLRDLRQARIHIAIVLDEYGGTAGLVTIEDILEELVGEIDDEYDPAPPERVDRIDDNTLEVDARVHVYEVNEELDVSIPEDGDYDTIGGFLFASMGKIPAKGEEFTHDNLHFSVLDAEPRKIKRLRIHVQRSKQTA